MPRFLALFFGTLLALTAPQAKAEVVATFYSHDFDDYFPHAFVQLQGTIKATGQQIDSNYGFTAVSVSPAILMGSVKGMIETKDAKYVSKSNPHFAVRLSDADYFRFMEFIEKWRNLPGKSYSLNRRNCVHFAMEAAVLLGASVNRQSKYFKKPKTFLLEVMKLNPHLKL